MKALCLLLIIALAGILVYCLHELSRVGDQKTARSTRLWSIEVLRTTDARGMTYESLHDSIGEPQIQGTALRWVDDKGRRWIFTNGALAHELDAEP